MAEPVSSLEGLFDDLELELNAGLAPEEPAEPAPTRPYDVPLGDLLGARSELVTVPVMLEKLPAEAIPTASHEAYVPCAAGADPFDALNQKLGRAQTAEIPTVPKIVLVPSDARLERPWFHAPGGERTRTQEELAVASSD